MFNNNEDIRKMTERYYYHFSHTGCAPLCFLNAMIDAVMAPHPIMCGSAAGTTVKTVP